MKRFEVLDHTADIGGRIYGKSLSELFVNAAHLLCFIAGAVQQGDEEKVVRIKLYGETVEELLVKFLNELIYHIYVKKVGGEIEKLSIKKKRGMFDLQCDVIGKGISVKREIKAATYHNLKIKEEKGIFSSEIIFDV